MTWSITGRRGWLRIESDQSVTAFDTRTIDVFGTTRAGFAVVIGDDRYEFQCDPAEARQCVDTVAELLT